MSKKKLRFESSLIEDGNAQQSVAKKANDPPNFKLKIDDAIHHQTVENVDLITFYNQIDSTSDMLGGTITALNSTLKEIENATYARFEPNVTAQIIKNVEPLKVELDVLKRQLQSVKDSLEPIGKSLLENVTFISNSIAVQGRLQGIDSLIATILKRIEIIENDNNQRWNRRATTTNILFTLLGVVIAMLGVAVAFWLGVFK